MVIGETGSLSKSLARIGIYHFLTNNIIIHSLYMLVQVTSFLNLY